MHALEGARKMALVTEAGCHGDLRQRHALRDQRFCALQPHRAQVVARRQPQHQAKVADQLVTADAGLVGQHRQIETLRPARCDQLPAAIDTGVCASRLPPAARGSARSLPNLPSSSIRASSAAPSRSSSLPRCAGAWADTSRRRCVRCRSPAARFQRSASVRLPGPTRLSKAWLTYQVRWRPRRAVDVLATVHLAGFAIAIWPAATATRRRSIEYDFRPVVSMMTDKQSCA